MIMNVYDFDKTIFYPDSSCSFIKFCACKYPGYVIPALLRSAGYIAANVRAYSVKTLKEYLFSFLSRIDDPERLVKDFWKKYDNNLQKWYLDQANHSDIIISASPEFLLKPIAEQYGFELIATLMDPGSGSIHGENCKGKEKVKRFAVSHSIDSVDEFYSDSLSDNPMAMISRKAFLVRKGKISEWPQK